MSANLGERPLPPEPPVEDFIARLFNLNTKRAAEEARGHIRWLRPDYQAPDAQQTTADLKTEKTAAEPAAAATAKKQPWPKTTPAQVETVRKLLEISPQTTYALAGHFVRKPTKGITQVLAALVVLGQVREDSRKWQLK